MHILNSHMCQILLLRGYEGKFNRSTTKKKNYDQPNKQLDKGFLFKKLHAKSLKLR